MTIQRWRLLFWAALAFRLRHGRAAAPAAHSRPAERQGAAHHRLYHARHPRVDSAFPKLADWRLLAGLSLYGAVIEIVQLVPALNRDGDVIDWLADTAAVGVVLLLFRLARR